MLGESSESTSGDDQDEETGVRYDETRSYKVEGYFLDVLLKDGKLKQIAIDTGRNPELKGLKAVGAFLGDSVEFEKPKAGDSFHEAVIKGSAPWKTYVEFDEDGLASSVKFVLPAEDTK